MYASKVLNTYNYGVYQKFWTQLFLISAIASLGFPTFILTYSKNAASEILNNLKYKFWGLYSFVAIVVSLFFSYYQNSISDVSIFYSSLLLILFITSSWLDSLLIVYKKFFFIVFTSFVYAVAIWLIHYTNINGDYDFKLLIKHLCLLASIKIILSLYIVRNEYILHKKHNAKSLNKVPIIASKKLWIQLGFNEVFNQLFRWFDKFLLSFILSSELFALYFNGSSELLFLSILFSAISSAVIQFWANSNSFKDAVNKIPLLHYSTQILSTIMMPLFWFLVLYRIEFLAIVFSEKYIPAATIFACSQITLPIRSFPFTAILQSEHRGDIINKGAILDFIIACILMYPLYLLLGLPGIVLSFVISTYIQAGYYLFQAKKITGFNIFEIFPIRTLISKFFISGIFIGSTYLLIYSFDISITLRFALGLTVLAMLISLLLIKELKPLFNKIN